MEGLALTGAWVDKEKGLLSMIALEMGVSSRLISYLKPGEPVVVMGPTGTPTEIPHGEDVLLAGGGLGNAVLFSIAKALKQHGNRVVYFAGYRKGEDLYKREEIESSPDQVVWSTDSGDAHHAGGGRRTRTSAATSCRRWWRMRRASWAKPKCRCRTCRASSRSVRIA